MAIGSLSYFFSPPQLGKPDPTEKKPLQRPDTRRRIIQHGSKTNTCWYYVFNMQRTRFKAPNTGTLEERKFEKIASARRKAISRHESSLPDITNVMHNELVRENFIRIIQKVAQQPGVTMVLDLLDSSEAKIKVSSFLPLFLGQSAFTNLYDFLCHLKYTPRLEIDQVFFRELELSQEDLYKTVRQRDLTTYQGIDHGLGWKGLSVLQKIAISDSIVKEISSRKYNLQKSIWHPTDSFEDFIKELKKNGPFAVGGMFGVPHHLTPPRFLSRKIEGRDLYGWSKGDPRNISPGSSHMILVVGAEKITERSFVYFVDPIDDSDPVCPEKQRIYVMSYERLVAPDSIHDLRGFMGTESPRNVGYALYGSK